MVIGTQSKTNIVQTGKFLLSGLVTNASAYITYLLLTATGLGHKTSMSLVFVAGMMLSYNMNKRWTFAGDGACNAAFWRFVASYGTAYILNLASMWVMVDRMGIPHYWVQAANIVWGSALLFIAQKFWIFASRPTETVH